MAYLKLLIAIAGAFNKTKKYSSTGVPLRSRTRTLYGTIHYRIDDTEKNNSVAIAYPKDNT